MGFNPYFDQTPLVLNPINYYLTKNRKIITKGDPKTCPGNANTRENRQNKKGMCFLGFFVRCLWMRRCVHFFGCQGGGPILNPHNKYRGILRVLLCAIIVEISSPNAENYAFGVRTTFDTKIGLRAISGTHWNSTDFGRGSDAHFGFKRAPNWIKTRIICSTHFRHQFQETPKWGLHAFLSLKNKSDTNVSQYMGLKHFCRHSFMPNTWNSLPNVSVFRNGSLKCSLGVRWWNAVGVFNKYNRRWYMPYSVNNIQLSSHMYSA